MNERDTINQIKASILALQYLGQKFTITEERHFADLLISVGRRNIAAIEVKSKLNSVVSAFNKDLYFLFKVRYFIYTDGESFLVFDRFNNPEQGLTTNFQGFTRIITTPIDLQFIANLKRKASTLIVEQIQGALNEFPNLNSLFDDFGKSIEDELVFGFDYGLYFEGTKTDVDSFEHQFFRHLLGNEVPEIIYRYCAFSRAFQILDDYKIAMLGLPGMNDTTEPNYIDNYLNDTDSEVWEMHPHGREMINRRFILSCTELEDDLMQWRLYGENAKGACVKLKAKRTLGIKDRFYLGKVKYATPTGEHPELDLIKTIIDTVRRSLTVDVRFVLIYVWRHFFKPHAYHYEKEIRLLYIHQSNSPIEKKWIVAEPYSIVNPMVVFNAAENEFPLDVTEVMLGPQRQERKLNVFQLEQMMLDKTRNIKITESKHKVYR